jgi:hypothetical protein
MSKILDSKYKRLLKVVVRSIHLVGAAGTFADAMMGISSSIYITTVIITGILLVFLEAYSSPIWLVQVRGVSVYIKLVIIWFMHIYPSYAVSCMIAVIVISGLISHAPSYIRYYSFMHNRVIHSFNDTLG